MDKYSAKVSELFNACPVNFVETCDKLAIEHRTIQQNITRFCCSWLYMLATNKNLYPDGRNQASVDTAKSLYDAAPEVLERGRYLPYI